MTTTEHVKFRKSRFGGRMKIIQTVYTCDMPSCREVFTVPEYSPHPNWLTVAANMRNKQNEVCGIILHYCEACTPTALSLKTKSNWTKPTGEPVDSPL